MTPTASRPEQLQPSRLGQSISRAAATNRQELVVGPGRSHTKPKVRPESFERNESPNAAKWSFSFQYLKYEMIWENRLVIPCYSLSKICLLEVFWTSLLEAHNAKKPGQALHCPGYLEMALVYWARSKALGSGQFLWLMLPHSC